MNLCKSTSKEKASGISVDSQILINSLPNSHITTKQWNTFHAVVSSGSFANAAELLHLSQPAISYIISKLEEQIGISLLKIDGRKAKVTEQGLDLYYKSQRLLKEVIELESYIRCLRDPSTKQLRLVVNTEFPESLIFRALSAYSATQGEPSPALTQCQSDRVEQALRAQAATLAIDHHVPDGFQADPLLEIELVPVAAASHPLCRLGREIQLHDLEGAVHIMHELSPRDPSGRRLEPNRGKNAWILNSQEAALHALRQGLGYGWIPQYRVQPELDGGGLQILPLACGSIKVMFHLIRGRSICQQASVSKLAKSVHDVVASMPGLSAFHCLAANPSVSMASAQQSA